MNTSVLRSPADVDLPSQMTEIEFPSLASTKT